MKKIILILFALVSFSIGSQELRNDTIDCGNFQLIIPLQDISIRKAQIERYEEGFYKTYSLAFGSALNKSSIPPHIIVHFGFDAELMLPHPDRVIYNCKLGNVVNSIYFTSGSKYFRRDSYPQYSMRIIFCYVTEENLEFANYILDNLIISDYSKP